MARKELHSEGVPIDQPPILTMPDIDQAFEMDRTVVRPNEEQLHKEYLDALAFNREPITIRIEPSMEENPPLFIECWVNGVGCEIFRDGKWQVVGAFPVGVEVVTRRMYVEALARSKKISVRTVVRNQTSERPDNIIQRSVNQRAAFSVIEDKNPKGAAWLRSVVNFT